MTFVIVVLLIVIGACLSENFRDLLVLVAGVGFVIGLFVLMLIFAYLLR